MQFLTGIMAGQEVYSRVFTAGLRWVCSSCIRVDFCRSNNFESSSLFESQAQSAGAREQVNCFIHLFHLLSLRPYRFVWLSSTHRLRLS